MTTAQNNELKPVAGLLEYPVLATGAADINAGDNVYRVDLLGGDVTLDGFDVTCHDGHATAVSGARSVLVAGPWPLSDADTAGYGPNDPSLTARS